MKCFCNTFGVKCSHSKKNNPKPSKKPGKTNLGVKSCFFFTFRSTNVLKVRFENIPLTGNMKRLFQGTLFDSDSVNKEKVCLLNVLLAI